MVFNSLIYYIKFGKINYLYYICNDNGFKD